MLHQKNAVIYGAAGSLGSAVSKALAEAGATVYLTGRTETALRQLAEVITSNGGNTFVHVVDAMDDAAINNHLDMVMAQSGTVDISFNLAGIDVIQDVPLVELPVNHYVAPVTKTLHTRFLTATAAARRMMQQGSGVILSLTATPGGIGYPFTAGFAAACTALENFSQNLASEVGPYGVRVVNIRSGGSPDSAVFKDALKAYPEIMTALLSSMEKDTMLKRLPPMSDIANVAVFLSSHLASSITGVTIDVTAGTTAALNYRAMRK